jgi:hypothetical protein
MSGGHSAEGLLKRVIVDKVHGCFGPFVGGMDGLAEGRGGDGFTDGGLVLSVNGTLVDVYLGSVGVDSRNRGSVSFVDTLVVNRFGIRIAIELCR